MKIINICLETPSRITSTLLDMFKTNVRYQNDLRHVNYVNAALCVTFLDNTNDSRTRIGNETRITKVKKVFVGRKSSYFNALSSLDQQFDF
jgi:hypothetical protein